MPTLFYFYILYQMNIHYSFMTNIILSVYVFEMMLYCCLSYVANLWLCALDVCKVIYMCVCEREREREFKEGHVENKIFTYMS